VFLVVGSSYKAICTDSHTKKAWFVENENLITWVNQQVLSDSLKCLGDGHPGIWKLIEQFNCPDEKIEILDWFHLIENLAHCRRFFKKIKASRDFIVARKRGASQTY